MRRGSILIEATLSFLLLILPTLAFQIEVTRAAQNLAVLHVAAFHFVRQRALGVPSGKARLLTGGRYTRLLPTWERRLVDWESWKDTSDRIHARLRVRYGTFFPFLQERKQLTRRCQFYW